MTALTRRRALALGLAAPLIANSAFAQTAWPSKPVRIIVPFPPARRPTSSRACWPSG